VWGVRGSTSRQLEKNPGISLEYIEDFTDLQTHQSLSTADFSDTDAETFIPSQWSSVIIQLDRLAERLNGSKPLTAQLLVKQLVNVGIVVSEDRGEELVSQAISLGIIKPLSNDGTIIANPVHPVVEKTRVITEAIRRRVANTLKVRGWEYVNYGFLLKGLEMENDIMRPGMNVDDQWRSHWIDALVREKVLKRQLVPHRHNPDDLVPVICLPDDLDQVETEEPASMAEAALAPSQDWEGLTPDQLAEVDEDARDMTVRIIVSVEQFTSFRNFAWCPLGSLHKRLRMFDPGMSFQRAVEYLEANNVVAVKEYENPQSEYMTKGISIIKRKKYTRQILMQRDTFIRLLLQLYEANSPITPAHIQELIEGDWDLDLWISIMETENVLNPLPGRSGQYSLFRTHHTVKLVAGDSTKD
ncbi:MAG: hypothetical protein KC496_09150, partial [Anaerolineae bacterium]|nr:hypothetical protein [Anaerolineae bacterium]